MDIGSRRLTRVVGGGLRRVRLRHLRKLRFRRAIGEGEGKRGHHRSSAPLPSSGGDRLILVQKGVIGVLRGRR